MSQGEVVGQAGYQKLQDGAGSDFRFSRGSELVVTDGLPRYYDMTLTGFHFGAVVASVAPGTALSTAPALTLWNPPNSGVILVPILFGLGYVSGTIGAGNITAAFNPSQQTVPSGGTESTTFNMILNATKGKGRAFTGSTISATPTACGVIGSINPTLATAPAAGGFAPVSPSDIEIAGRWIVPPGASLSFTGIAAAGTTPLVSLSMSWIEIPTTVS